jgi:hypothetical protein
MRTGTRAEDDGTDASAGGGAAGSTLYSCVLSGNLAHGNYGGGGAVACTLSKCVVTNNADTSIIGHAEPAD